MSMINLVIDEKQYIVDSKKTILEVAHENNIYIPTLCHFDGVEGRANCRLCVVEIEGMRVFQPACVTKVKKGMVIHTNTQRIRESRKATLELILSHHAVDCHHCLRIGSSKEQSLDSKFCEMCFWCDCVRDGFCELQALARQYHVDVLPYTQHEADYQEDRSLGSIIRNPNKCIKCRRCVDICDSIQTVHNLSMANRGHDLMVVPELGKTMKESSCVRCGHCVDVCPTGAIYMMEHKDEIIYMAHSYNIDTIAQVSKNIIPEITKLYKLKPGDITMEGICSALHKIGLNQVITDEEAMYLSSVQAATIINQNIEKEQVILTSSDSVVRFVEKFFPEMKNKLKVYENSQKIFGKMVASQKTEKPLKSINITSLKEMAVQAAEIKDVDYVINARELYRIFLRTGGAPAKRIPMAFDKVCKENIVYPSLFNEKEWMIQKKIETFELEISGSMKKCVVAYNLGQVRTLLEGEYKKYDIIRLMA